MKVLVTGAGGFIGSHLSESLAKKGYQVKAFIRYNSRNSWGWLENSPQKDSIEIITGDIRNYDSVKNAVRQTEIVFHLAALIGIPYSYTSPDSYVDTNVKGTLNVLQAARELKVKKVVHTSTSEVYGTAQFVPITEEHPINPQSPYAASKAAADLLALSFYRSFGLPMIICRPFNAYGPRQSARAIVPTIITQILNGNKKIRLGSIHTTRDLTFVKDTVEGFIKAGESKKAAGEVINIGNNQEISIKDLVALISGLMRVRVSIQSDSIRKRPGTSEVERLMGDNKKAARILGWSPAYTLEEGLKDTIHWLKLNKDLYKADIYNV